MSNFWIYATIILTISVTLSLTALRVIPDWQLKRVRKSEPDTKESELFKLEDEARRTVAQIIGGFFFILSVAITGAQLKFAQDERTDKLNLDREGQITERFTRAIDQLGKENDLQVRLGGIYALERIAKDSEKDYWQIMEIICAYIRIRSPVDKKKASEDQNLIDVDIHAAISVIRRRETRTEPSTVNLSQANLSGADLRSADLSRADLSRANLNGVDLFRANLNNANLRQADLTGVNLSGANLSGANLSGANLSGANLSGANLRRADLRGADLGTAMQIVHTLGDSNREILLYGEGSGSRKADLSDAKYDDKTQLPEGFGAKQRGMMLVNAFSWVEQSTDR